MRFRLPFFREPEDIKKTTASDESEAGVSGDIVFEDFDDVLKREDGRSIKDYRVMRDSDATLDSLFSIVTLPILSATFGVKAAEDDEDEEQAEFVRRCLFRQPYLGGMEVPFSLVLEQMLHAVIDGFEVFERVYKIDEDGRVVVKKLALRDARTVKIRVDDHGGYEGVVQKATVGLETKKVVLPADRTFLFTYGKADSQYYGRSAFKSLYENWDRKRKLEYLDGIAHQSSAVYPKILARTQNTVISGGDGRGSGVKGILSKLAKLGKLKPTMSLPYGYDVKELKGGSHDGISESIERQNSEMARAFLASFSLLGSQGSHSSGSYALSADQSDLFMIALKGTMNLITDHINQYWIADLIDRNFPVGKRRYPEFYFDDLTDETSTFLKGIFTKLIEKDKVSDEIVAGIQEKIRNKFDIEELSVERDEEENTADSASDNAAPITANEPRKNDMSASAKEEGNGGDANKFRRELFGGEEKVKWSSLEKQAEKVAAKFEKEALPLLEQFSESVAKNPDKISLPKNYLELVEKTYRNAYNYGKLAASDEAGEKAPKTKLEEDKNTENYMKFIENRQLDEVKSLVESVRLKVPVSEPSRGAYATAIESEMAAWTQKTIDGMKDSLFGYANNAGRADAFAKFDEEAEDEAVYMWSALLENSCAVCQVLDGRVFSREQMLDSVYQPGTVHLNCRCIWVRVTGDKPKVQGLPAKLADLAFVQNAPKALLQREGIVTGMETKQNAVERVEFNQISNGDTLEEVEDAIRDKNVEFFAAFDGKGAKLAEISDGAENSVQIGEAMDYLKRNKAEVLTHNHPHGSSFSMDDLMVSAELDVEEMRAVSREFDYIVKKTKEGWPKVLTEKSDAELHDLYDDYIEDARMQFNLLRKYDKKLAKFNEDERWRWLTNETMESFAEDYGLDYNKIERK